MSSSTRLDDLADKISFKELAPSFQAIITRLVSTNLHFHQRVHIEDIMLQPEDFTRMEPDHAWGWIEAWVYVLKDVLDLVFGRLQRENGLVEAVNTNISHLQYSLSLAIHNWDSHAESVFRQHLANAAHDLEEAERSRDRYKRIAQNLRQKIEITYRLLMGKMGFPEHGRKALGVHKFDPTAPFQAYRFIYD